jgi:hypothetical protein
MFILCNEFGEPVAIFYNTEDCDTTAESLGWTKWTIRAAQAFTQPINFNPTVSVFSRPKS